MELTKKTTILFPPDLYDRLAQVAEQRSTSVGDLVRKACAEYYGIVSVDDRIEAVNRLKRLSLPVADAEVMKEESQPAAADLLP